MNSDTRISRILDAAEEIMSAKGFILSSIGEIAKKAGVADSVIYSFFKGKEDLLFSIPGRRMQVVLRTLTEQLKGILDPSSKLTKMIWFHLHFNDTYPDYARLLLLECRSNRNFYQHKAYNLIREYAGIMLGILEEGVEKGVFLSDLNMRLVRDIIWGVLDYENLSVLASGEINEGIQDFDDILAIILPMISVGSESLPETSDKRFRILAAAEAIFAEKGYTQATISDIAKYAQVSEGTIYEYFKNKEELLLSIPEQRFKEHKDSLEEIFEMKTPLKKLRRLILNHFLVYLKEPNFLKVFLLHVQLNKQFYTSPAYEAFKNYTQRIVDILEEGKRDGTIRMDVNSRVFKNLFLGAFSHMALRWLILAKHEIDKMREIDDVAMLLSKAISNTEPNNVEFSMRRINKKGKRLK